MKLTKRLTAFLLAFLMTLALAACGDDNKPNTEVKELSVVENGVYRKLYSSEVTTLNYLITSQENEMSILANVIDCLVEYDSYGNVEPALALDWSSNDDATVWTFHLREGVKWMDRDGNEVAEVTAHDFVTSAYYVCDAAHAATGANQYTSVVAGAEEYFNWTAYQISLQNAVDGTDENGNPVKLITNSDGEQEILAEVPEASLNDIGVKALDDHTLEYTLKQPCPYFVSMVSYGVYMPTNAAFLEQCGSKFGTSNEYLLYCGAYILSDYQPQVQRVLTANPSYWEPEAVHISSVISKYNAEASSVSTTMYLAGEVDSATISSDLLTTMIEDPQYANSIHPTRTGNSYSYWYLFNFDPNFDDEYEPENWKLAVNNENFRLAVISAFNRIPALATRDALDPASLLNNTITPVGFASASKDYTAYGDLAAFTSVDRFDTDAAAEYKDKAIAELTAAGASFPIKMLVLYNPTDSNWANECQVVEQQIEGVLGTDFIDIIIQAGPESGFLSERRSGHYAFMKCNWGADYADPETWTDPFSPTQKFSFIYQSENEDTIALYNEYWSMVEHAKSITTDMEARYEAFAKAEAFLLEHGFAIPIHCNSRSYEMSNLNVFEGQYAPFGVATLRYKDQYLYNGSMSLTQFQEAYETWKSALAS